MNCPTASARTVSAGDLFQSRIAFAQVSNRRQSKPENERKCHTCRGKDAALVPADKFLHAINVAGRPRHHRFAAQVPL
jgi:hypothetical protein